MVHASVKIELIQRLVSTGLSTVEATSFIACIGKIIIPLGRLGFSCATLALADVGIMMFDSVAAVSVVCMHNLVILIDCVSFFFFFVKSCVGKNLVIDPVSEKENYQNGSLMIACLPSRNEVTQLIITEEWSSPKIHEAVELCLDECTKA
uniref:Uncharacterized protein n=1 Tax=Lactuca sativa TaxID=4236 RepID=A0A9R1XUA3_LACSA|nr:hypothetical protein LSAT_V11C100018530 [Lactuca sativa]